MRGFGNPFIVAMVVLLIFFVMAAALGVDMEIMALILVPASMFLFMAFSDFQVRTTFIVMGFLVALLVGIAFSRLMRT